MPLYALDTDTVTLYRKNHPRVVARAAAEPPPGPSTTVITVEEQLGGWYTQLRQATQPAQVEHAYAQLVTTVVALAKFPILPYTRAAIARYEALLRAKLNVKKNDLRIAAIALEFGATVVTRNVSDFRRVPGLAVEDWSV